MKKQFEDEFAALLAIRPWHPLFSLGKDRLLLDLKKSLAVGEVDFDFYNDLRFKLENLDFSGVLIEPSDLKFCQSCDSKYSLTELLETRCLLADFLNDSCEAEDENTEFYIELLNGSRKSFLEKDWDETFRQFWVLQNYIRCHDLKSVTRVNPNFVAGLYQGVYAEIFRLYSTSTLNFLEIFESEVTVSNFSQILSFCVLQLLKGEEVSEVQKTLFSLCKQAEFTKFETCSITELVASNFYSIINVETDFTELLKIYLFAKQWSGVRPLDVLGTDGIKTLAHYTDNYFLNFSDYDCYASIVNRFLAEDNSLTQQDVKNFFNNYDVLNYDYLDLG